MENTLLDQASIRWHSLGDNIEAKWNTFLDVVGDDPQTLWICGTVSLVVFVYWFYAGIYTLMDITNRPKFLRKYKIQPGLNEPVDTDKLLSAIKVVLINQIIVGLPASYIMYEVVFKNRNISNIRELPSLLAIVIDIAVLSVLEEILFYYVHRFLHHRSIYKYFHKKHHEWTAPIAAMTFYCHPVEHILSNLFPIGIAVGLMKSHIITAWMFFVLAIVNSMTDHTGYSFPFSATSVRFHDYHHAKFNYNFGVLGWLDKLHGTYREVNMDSAAVKQNGIKTNNNKHKKQK